MESAAEFRQTFGKDVVIDIVGFRRYGHNEIDEPMFTQPLMYKIIKKKDDVLKVYADKLIAEGRVTAEKLADMKAAAHKNFNIAFDKAKDPKFRPPPSAWFGTQWKVCSRMLTYADACRAIKRCSNWARITRRLCQRIRLRCWVSAFQPYQTASISTAN